MKHCTSTRSLHGSIAFEMTSEFLGKKLGDCHSLVGARPSVIFSELANPLDH